MVSVHRFNDGVDKDEISFLVSISLKFFVLLWVLSSVVLDVQIVFLFTSLACSHKQELQDASKHVGKLAKFQQLKFKLMSASSWIFSKTI